MAQVLNFIRLMDEAPSNVNISAGLLQGTGALAGSFELDISAGSLQGTGALAGSFELGIPAGPLQGTGALAGSANTGAVVSAGVLQGIAQLVGSFALDISAGPLIATAQWASGMGAEISLNPPSEDVKNILAAEPVLELIFETNLFIGEMPPEPDVCVAVYDAPGEPPEPAYIYERPGIEIIIRGDQGGYKIGRNLARNIQDRLNGLSDETWGGSRYIGIWATGDVAFLDYDKNNRPRFRLGFRLHRTRMISALPPAGGFISSGLRPPSEDMKDMLAAEIELALTFGLDLFIGQLPVFPDECVGIFDGPGEPPEPAYNYGRPHVQVLVRGDQGHYRATHIRAQRIRDLLNGRNGETWGGSRYIGVWAMADVNPLGNDENRRPRFSINFRLHRTTG